MEHEEKPVRLNKLKKGNYVTVINICFTFFKEPMHLPT